MSLLDTDTLTLLMYGHERVGLRMRQADSPAITIVSRIEILQGRFASVLKAANGHELELALARLARNEQFIAPITVITFDATAMAEFDRLRLDRKFKRIGRADLLIAAIALGHRATVVTRNLKHFRLIPGLALDNWAD